MKLSELANMPVADSNRVLGELVRSAKSNRREQRSVLDARVREFEVRYEMSSDVMHKRLRNGALQETAEIARWLMTLAARENRGSRK